MLMARDQLRAIYEVLFREGVMVAKKDRRPRSLHPHVPGGVTHLQVMRAMASLRARGLVRETFAWRHFYWYLTDEGVAHLRRHLHLPPEIVPASLQRVRRPVAMVMPARRRPGAHAPHGQAAVMQGPVPSCPPKRGHPPAAEDPAGEERRVYRRRQPEEEGGPEPPVVPAAAAPGTLAARPGPPLQPEPQVTGQLHPGPSHRGESGVCVWPGEMGAGAGRSTGGGALLPPAGGALSAPGCGVPGCWATWLLLLLLAAGPGRVRPRRKEHMGPGQPGQPGRPSSEHSLGRGVGLVALDWQDQL